jgi:hypothetical protein
VSWHKATATIILASAYRELKNKNVSQQKFPSDITIYAFQQHTGAGTKIHFNLV